MAEPGIVLGEHFGMFKYIIIIGVYSHTFATLANGAGLSLRLMPVLTMAQVESSKYVNVSVGIRRYGSFHNFTMELVFDILLPLNNLKMNMGYFVRRRNSEYWMYNKTYDFCAFLERTSIDRFGSLVVDDFKYRGKVPKRCPIMPERLVYKNVTFNRVKLPSFLPETKYGFTADCFKGPKNEYVFRSLWHGILKRIMA